MITEISARGFSSRGFRLIAIMMIVAVIIANFIYQCITTLIAKDTNMMVGFDYQINERITQTSLPLSPEWGWIKAIPTGDFWIKTKGRSIC